MGMKSHSLRIIMSGSFLYGVLILGGCASTPSAMNAEALETVSGRVVVEGVSYEEVFIAARAVLAQYRFGINRVDAARGVITTHPKRTVGLGSIWDREQSTLGQEFEDFANQQERTIRVVFERDGDDSSVVGVIEVLVHRVHRPNWRVESESIRLSTHARSRDARGIVQPSEFREPMGHDLALAQRIAQEITRRFE